MQRGVYFGKITDKRDMYEQVHTHTGPFETNTRAFTRTSALIWWVLTPVSIGVAAVSLRLGLEIPGFVPTIIQMVALQLRVCLATR